MNTNRRVSQIKYGFIAGLTSVFLNYIVIQFCNALNSSFGNFIVVAVPILSLVIIILGIIEIISFKDMFYGYITYILGYILSLILLMKTELISKSLGWFYIIVLGVFIVIKIWLVIKNGKWHY